MSGDGKRKCPLVAGVPDCEGWLAAQIPLALPTHGNKVDRRLWLRLCRPGQGAQPEGEDVASRRPCQARHGGQRAAGGGVVHGGAQQRAEEPGKHGEGRERKSRWLVCGVPLKLVPTAERPPPQCAPPSHG